MRILFVLPYVPTVIRVRPYNLLRQLTQRHAVTVLAVGSEAEAARAEEVLAQCRRVELVPFAPARAVLSCATGAIHGDPLQASVCRSPEFDRQLSRILRTDNFDVVHVEHLRAAHARRHIPAGLPSVYDAVDCISLLLERTRLRSHSLRQRVLAAIELRRTRAYEGSVLSSFDRVLVTAPEDRRALQSLAPAADVTVVPNGVDLDRFRPLTEPPDPATIVFTGKMSYHANVSAALYFARHILPLIRRVRPDVRLRVVGSSPAPSVRELGRDPAITVTGDVPDLRDALAGATVAVCPVTVKVGIQNKVLEAMATKVPVVSTPEGLEGLAAQPNRDLLVGESAELFARQVCRLLDNPHLRHELADAGYEYVQTHHRWESAAKLVENIYEQANERTNRLRTTSIFATSENA